MSSKEKILVCGILPPPFFGHSMMYKMLMESSFIKEYDVVFLNLHFWTYGKHKKVTGEKLFKMAKYLSQYIFLISIHRPKYVLFNMSFDKMPFLKDYLFCFIGHLLGCKIVLHDMGQYLPELHASSEGFLKCLVKHLLNITMAIIVMGEKVREMYKDLYPYNRMVVVPGSTEDTVNLTVPLIPKENVQEIRVLYFSFLSVSKGVWTALNAIPEVVAANKNIVFKFAGPTESEELHSQMKDFIEHKSLSSKVDYIGYVGDVNKRTECFRNADIFIFPTHRDVFGLVLLHAMAESVAVIASREGSIPEIIQDGVNGVLFTKGDHKELAVKILQLAADQKLRKQYSLENRCKYLARYAPEVYGQTMIHAFVQIRALG